MASKTVKVNMNTAKPSKTYTYDMKGKTTIAATFNDAVDTESFNKISVSGTTVTLKINGKGTIKFTNVSNPNAIKVVVKKATGEEQYNNTLQDFYSLIAAENYQHYTTKKNVISGNIFNNIIDASDKSYNGKGFTISAGAGNDEVTGTIYADTISGGAGNDILSGNKGNDSISGGNGNDSITGGEGNDKLTGGKGADIFEFSKTVGGDDRSNNGVIPTLIMGDANEAYSRENIFGRNERPTGSGIDTITANPNEGGIEGIGSETFAKSTEAWYNAVTEAVGSWLHNHNAYSSVAAVVAGGVENDINSLINVFKGVNYVDPA